MNKINNFDVLIVYSEKLALSASDSSVENRTPFLKGSNNESYNVVYGYFMETCKKLNLKAAFTTSKDIIGAGTCSSYWQYEAGKWQKVVMSCFSELIFDKFSPIRKGIKTRRELLFSSLKIKPFNDPDLYNLFFDKQKTYEKLSKYAIPTISLGEDNNIQSVEKACKTLTKLLSNHPECEDFGTDIVMKDRFGAGGRHIYKFKSGQSKNMLAAMERNTRVSYIIQPFAMFDKGFSHDNCLASTDIRLIYLKGEIVQSYIRVAKPGDFRCNEHQGGLLTYLSLSELPKALVFKSGLIAKLLDKNDSLFTLDFIMSNNGNAYFLEGNTGPGLDWNMSLKKNEEEAKKLINMVVGELGVRANCIN
jgi:glutathione synthase/RimK-type ligase-like ATP-grasp enzyme